MIQSAVESLDIDGTYTFVVQQEHMTNYPWLEEHLKSFAETVNIVILDHVTEGAACSLLKAKEFINNDEPLISINSDQVLHWDSSMFLEKCRLEPNVSGNDPPISDKHSFVKVNEEGQYPEAPEKVAISNMATVGLIH